MIIELLRLYLTMKKKHLSAWFESVGTTVLSYHVDGQTFNVRKIHHKKNGKFKF